MCKKTAIRSLVLTLGMAAALFLGLAAVRAGETGSAAGRHCPRCGCDRVTRSCRPVRQTKRVEETYWDCRVDEYCIPVRRFFHRCPTGEDPKACGHTDGETGACGGYYTGKPRDRNRLVQRTAVREVPVLYWITETTCEKCGAACGPAVKSSSPPGDLPPGKGQPAPTPADPPATRSATPFTPSGAASGAVGRGPEAQDEGGEADTSSPPSSASSWQARLLQRVRRIW